MSLPELETARLRLRPLRLEDADALFEAFADPRAMRYWSCGPFETVAALRAWLDPENWPAWAVLRGGEPIGRVLLRETRAGVGEISHILAPSHWRQGYAREAMAAVIGHGFSHGLRRIWADVDPDNDASIALLETLGFTLEGRLREEWETHIGVRDTLVFGLLRREWEDLPISRSG